MKTFLWIWLGNFFPWLLFSQPVRTVRLQEAENISHVRFYHLKFDGGNERNSVTQLLRDSLGRMWIATKNGLILYDGKRVKVYLPGPRMAHCLPHHFITRLYLDRRGTLWVGTERGMVFYRPASDDFGKCPDPLKEAYITDICGDTSGALWISDHRANKLYRYRPQGQQVEEVLAFPAGGGGDGPQLTWIGPIRKDRLYLTDASGGLLVFWPASGHYERIRLMRGGGPEPSERTLARRMGKIKADPLHPSVLWIGTHLGFLIRFDTRTGRQERYVYNRELTNHGFQCYLSDFDFDRQGRIWVATWFYGLYRLDPRAGRMIHILPSPARRQGISNTIVTAVYHDQGGHWWFGTEYQGIDVACEGGGFGVFPRFPPRKGYLPALHFLSVAGSGKPLIWIGAEGAVYAVEMPSGKARKRNDWFPGASRFFALKGAPDGMLWAGTDRGVYVVDTSGRLQRHLRARPGDFNSLPANAVGALAREDRNIWWMGTFGAGAVRYDARHQRFYRFRPDSADPLSLSHAYVQKILIDPKGRVWIATLDGLNLFRPQTGRFTVFHHSERDSLSIGSSVINDLAYAGGHLWVATQGGGLNRYDDKRHTFSVFTTDHGLPSNNIRALQTDANGMLWLATPRSLVRFNPVTGDFAVYDAADGLVNRVYVENMGWQELTFSPALAHRDRRGFLYFGGPGGWVYFHPDSLPHQTYRAPLHIDRLRINGKEVKLSSGRIRLKPHQNQLEVSFILMHLIRPEKNRYAWKLVPYDSVWHRGGWQATARYANLPPGRYRLYYKAIHNDGPWTVAREPLYITIRPYFYQQTWFYGAVVLFFLTGAAGLGRYRHYVLRQIEKRRRQMRYSWSKLTPEEAANIQRMLEKQMVEEKIYLDPQLNLTKLAGVIGVKPSYLSQVIHQYYHQHFYEFLNRYRVAEAQRLLRDTDLKIEAVAYDAGFNSLSTFNAVFKKLTGTTPSAYRKSNLP